MSVLKWFAGKTLSENPVTIQENQKDSIFKIPIKFICFGDLTVRDTIIEEIQLESDKLKLSGVSMDVEIMNDEIRKLEYSKSLRLLRVLLKPNIVFKHNEFDNIFKSCKTRVEFRCSIFLMFNISDFEENDSDITKLFDNCDKPLSTMTHKVEDLFRSDVLKSETLESFHTSATELAKIDECTDGASHSKPKNRDIVPVISGSNNIMESLNSNGYSLPEINQNIVTDKISYRNEDAPSTVEISQLNGRFISENASFIKIKKKARKRKLDSPLKNGKLSKLSINRKFLYSPSPSHNIEITEDDFQCLAPRQYLNDNIINMYLTYIYFEKLSEKQRESTYLFNVFFNTKLIGTTQQQRVDTAETRHARVAKWTKKVDIFAKDFIVIPVIEDEHWFLVIVCFPWMAGVVNYQELFKTKIKVFQKIPTNNTVFAKETRLRMCADIEKQQNFQPMPCILIFDSLEKTKRKDKLKIIREYLKSEWDARRSSTDGPLVFDQITCRGYSPNVLRQDNGYDCGLYLLQYVESFFAMPPRSYMKEVFQKGMIQWFDRRVIEEKRQHIIEVILSRAKEVSADNGHDDDDDDSSTL